MPIRRELWRRTRIPYLRSRLGIFRTGFANQHSNLLDQVHQETGHFL